MARRFDGARIGEAASAPAWRLLLSAVAAALLSAGLGACSSISDDTAARVAFAPGRYGLYTCKELAERTEVVRLRQVELEQLMSRAEQGAGGAFVSAIAYRSEYVQGRGELAELSRTANERQCAMSNRYSSGRAVF